MISIKGGEHIQYSLQNCTQPSPTKDNEKLDVAKKSTRPIHASGTGAVDQPISTEELFPLHSSHAIDFFNI